MEGRNFVHDKKAELTFPGPSSTLWLRNDLSSDPVFASEGTKESYELSLGVYFRPPTRVMVSGVSRDVSHPQRNLVQPYQHCQDMYFPTMAKAFGLKRVVPTAKDLRLPLKKGPTCVVKEATGDSSCHSGPGYLPAFFYKHKDLRCESSAQSGLPTLHFRWSYGTATYQGQTLPALQLRMCYNCFNNGVTGCTMIGKVIVDVSTLPPAPPPQSVLPSNASAMSLAALAAGIRKRPILELPKGAAPSPPEPKRQKLADHYTTPRPPAQTQTAQAAGSSSSARAAEASAWRATDVARATGAIYSSVKSALSRSSSSGTSSAQLPTPPPSSSPTNAHSSGSGYSTSSSKPSSGSGSGSGSGSTSTSASASNPGASAPAPPKPHTSIDRIRDFHRKSSQEMTAALKNMMDATKLALTQAEQSEDDAHSSKKETERMRGEMEKMRRERDKAREEARLAANQLKDAEGAKVKADEDHVKDIDVYKAALMEERRKVAAAKVESVVPQEKLIRMRALEGEVARLHRESDQAYKTVKITMSDLAASRTGLEQMAHRLRATEMEAQALRAKVGPLEQEAGMLKLELAMFKVAKEEGSLV